MQIIPTLELMDGHAVTLRAGSLDEPQIWHTDPLKMAESFAKAGAEQMQITDFDAMRGDLSNVEMIRDIIRTVGIPVQVAGGIRSRERAEFWYENGASGVVVSTWAIQAPQQLRALCHAHPDWVVLGLDIHEGHLLTHGWQTHAAMTPEAMLDAFADAPLSAVMLTDINRDRATAESPSDGQLGLIDKLATATRHRVIVSGAAYTLDDVSRLSVMPGISAAIVSRALFNKTFELAEAIELARPALEPTAPFQ